MTTDESSVPSGIDAVRDWILAQHPELDEVAADTDIFAAGLVQSLQLMQLLVVIERAHGERVDRKTLKPDDLRTLAGIEARFFSPEHAGAGSRE